MGWLENYPREYYSKYDHVEVKNSRGWFEVYRLPGDVYAIAEPQQFQEVNFFLIIGDGRAMLLDTGMGIEPIEPLIHELLEMRGIDTTRENLTVINCHCHFDHTGNNYVFQPVHVYDDPLALRIAEHGLTKEEVGGEMEDYMFQFGYPEGFDPDDYHVKPYQVIPVTDGQAVDLGNRTSRVIHTPGHCPDHLCLYDEPHHILFTGDLLYLGALYTHFDNPIYGTGNIYDYRDSLNRVRDELPEDVKLYCSHNDLVTDYAKLCEVADAMQQVIDTEEGKETGLTAQGAAPGHDYGEAENQPHVYQFGAFSIYCRPGLVTKT